MYRYILAILSAILFAIPSAAAMSTAKPLEIGIVPYLSARVLITQYEPLRKYLENTLNRPVHIYSAPDFRQYLENSQNGDFDITVSSAHFARLLQIENGYIPLAKYSQGGHGLVMIPTSSKLKSPEELRGKTLAIPFSLSLASIVCMTNLKERGLLPGVDYKTLELPSFESAIIALEKGEADAAVSAPAALRQMNKSLQVSVKTLLDTGEFTSLIYLAHPRIGNSDANLLRLSLLRFSHSREGKIFFEATGFGKLEEVNKKDMNNLDRYLPETRRILNSQK